MADETKNKSYSWSRERGLKGTATVELQGQDVGRERWRAACWRRRKGKEIGEAALRKRLMK